METVKLPEGSNELVVDEQDEILNRARARVDKVTHEQVGVFEIANDLVLDVKTRVKQRVEVGIELGDVELLRRAQHLLQLVAVDSKRRAATSTADQQRC